MTYSITNAIKTRGFAVFIVTSTLLFVATVNIVNAFNAPAIIAVVAGALWGELSDRLSNLLATQVNEGREVVE